jgi:tmRNA-binding protein
VELALARGKRSYDQRQDLAKRHAQREISRASGRRRQFSPVAAHVRMVTQFW